MIDDSACFISPRFFKCKRCLDCGLQVSQGVFIIINDNDIINDGSISDIFIYEKNCDVKMEFRCPKRYFNVVFIKVV
jgi:hypothetical protein